MRFGRAVNAAAAQTAAGSNAATAALQRNERAAVSAFQKISALQSAAARAGLTQSQSAALYNQSTAALQRYVNQLTRGQTDTLSFQRSTERFNLALGTSRLRLKEFTEAAQKATQSNLIGFLQRIAQTSVLIAGPLSGAAARLTTFASIATHVGVQLAVVAAGAAAATFAFGKLSAAIIRVRREYESYSLALTSVTGSTELANKQFQRIIDLSRKTGQDLGTLTRSWARMQAAAAGTNLEGERAWKIFETLSFAAAKLGSSTQETEGILRAIEQIISKGTVSAEELRGQLGDRLPGAVQIMARSLGIGTKALGDLMKKGEITQDALVEFANEIAKLFNIDVTQAIDTVAASEGRLNNEWNLALLAINDVLGISDAYKNILNETTSVLQGFTTWLNKSTGAIDAAGQAAQENEGYFSSFIRNVGEYIDVLNRLGPMTDFATAKAAKRFEMSQYGFKDVIQDFSKGTPAEGQKAFMDFLRGGPQATNPLDPLGGGKGDTASTINRRKKAIRDASQSIADLGREYQRLFMMPGQQRWAELQDEITTDVANFADKLKDAGVSAGAAAPLIAQYAESLRLVKEGAFAAAQTVTAVELLADAFENAGNAATDAFIDALFSGEDALKSLAEVAKQTAAAILKEMLKLAVINPLLNQIFGQGLPTLGGIGGTGAGNVAGAVASSVFSSAVVPLGIPLFHKGTDYAQALPRLHNGYGLRSDEFAAILQEGEKVTPKGKSTGGSTIVNIHNYSNEQIQQEKRRVGQDELVDIIIGKTIQKMQRGAGDGMMRNRYGVSPTQRRAFV